MVGGVSGMMGAIALGPRKGRFDEVTGAVNAMPGHNQALAALGTGILWFGWYGFNCGSTLVLVDAGNLAGKVAVNTTIAAAAGIISDTAVIKLLTGNYDLSIAMNCILAGLVGITSAWVYIAGHYLFLALKIDDPLDAAPLHGITGGWGLLCVGIFCTDANVQYAAYPNVNDACARGEQFGVQVVGMIIIFTWCVGTAGIVFFGIKATIGLRVPAYQEDIGMDLSEHGGDGFADVDDLKARALATAYAAQPEVATREIAPAPVTMMAPMGTMPVTGSPPMMVGAAYPPQQMYSYPVTTTY